MRFRALSIIIAIMALTNSAHGCSSLEQPTEEETVAKASTIFLAHLLRVEEAGSAFPDEPHHGGNGDKIIEGTFNVLEVIKGVPPEDHKIKSLAYGTGNCAIPLLVGNDYLIMLEKDNVVMIGHGNASALINIENEPTKRDLARLRDMVKKPPQK
jgi:hypothetical protein